MRTKSNPKLISVCLTFFVLATFISCKKDNNFSRQNAVYEQNNSVSFLSDKLVGWYTFNGDDLDHSGYGNNINFNNATPTEGKQGRPNSAYYFNGSSSYMTIPNSSSLNPQKITLAAFVKPEGFYQGQCHRNTILYKANNDNTPGKYLLAFDDMAYYDFLGCDEPVKEHYENFYGSFGDGQATAAGARDDSMYIKSGAWYAVIYTYDGKYARLYINGVLKKENKVSTTFTPNNVPVYIGKSPDSQFPYWFTGTIDEIRIYSKAFTEDQIKQLSEAIHNN